MMEWTTEIRVPYADTDAMSVVYHCNYIKYFEVARGELMRSMGYAYRKMEEEGVMLPVIECACRYKVPAVYDDEILVKAVITETKGATITIRYEARRKTDGVLLVDGMTRHAVTTTDFKPVRLRQALPQFYDMLSNKQA